MKSTPDIVTVADLIEKLIEVEQAKIAEFGDISHPVAIGDMWEGLARRVAGETVLPGTGLKIVEGFISGNRQLSRQIDCMIVIGEGRQLPNTNHWIFPAPQVVAAVEVKK